MKSENQMLNELLEKPDLTRELARQQAYAIANSLLSSVYKYDSTNTDNPTMIRNFTELSNGLFDLILSNSQLDSQNGQEQQSKS